MLWVYPEPAVNIKYLVENYKRTADKNSWSVLGSALTHILSKLWGMVDLTLTLQVGY